MKCKNKIKFLISILLFFILVINIKIVNATEELPDNGAKISSAQVIQTKTGTGPWDDNDEPGNDSSEDNNIVRSFDQVTWTIENTMVLNNGTADSYTGGKIYFEATLPDVFTSETTKWDVDSMGWIENAQISYNGLTLTGYYQMSNTGITVPGKQTLVFVAKLFGAANGIEFSPTIKTWLNGNSEENYKNIDVEKTIVSAVPNYNIKLVRNTGCATRTTVNLDGENVTGRMYGYSIMYQLYNLSVDKGLKGIEYPTGDITLDLEMLMQKREAKGGELIDITSKVTPILWNYQVADTGTKGLYKNRDMFTGISGFTYQTNWTAPGGKVINNRRDYCVLDSGNITMVQDNNLLKTTLSEYKFDGIFPGFNYTSPITLQYTDNIGVFGSIYLQILVPDWDEYDQTTDYYLNINNKNFNAISISGQNTNVQINTDDDSSNVQYTNYTRGSYGSLIYLYGRNKNNITNILHTVWNAGDGRVVPGQEIMIRAYLNQNENNDEDKYPRTVNTFVKFDGSCYEPALFTNGSKYTTTYGHMDFKMWYVTKVDGTNWENQEEQNSTLVEKCLLYENLSDIPKDKLCVGVYFESQGGELRTRDFMISIPCKIKEDAKIGKTYSVVQSPRYYTYELDRSVYTATNSDVEWPTDQVYSPIYKYVKTEYDENGNQISGTHAGGTNWGNTLQVIGATPQIKISSINNDTNENKINYDLGKNEYDVTYKIQPSIVSSYNGAGISDVTVIITSKLPQGITYNSNSCNIGEPNIINSDDGTVQLKWIIAGCTVNEKIEDIIFSGHINEESANGKQYEVEASIYADPEKIGTTSVTDRTATNTIQVTNLSSHRLYKTMNTPVIEKNGEIHFTLSYKNNTDDTIPDFQLLDILPYNGDGRGTSYTGTYTLDRVVVSKEDANVYRAVGDMQVLYTNDESARSATSKDENLGSGWTEVTSENIKQNAIAIVVKGEVEAQGKVNVDVYLKTSDNKGLDKYVNSATAQVYKATEEMTTSSVVSQVVERTIEGIAWEDVNANGLKDENEEVLQNIELTLTDSLGNQVTDVNGNIVESVRTDNNGYYKFANLPKGNYYISVAIFNSDYEITEKETGTNSQINSKFNVEAKETDEITKLNSIDLPILTMSNVNVGFVKKATSIVIKHVTEEGENLIEPQTVEGRIDDIYETQDRASEFSEYELKTTPSNASGTMQAEQIEVVYVYSLVKGKITITKVDKTDETKTLSGATFKVEKLTEDDTIDSSFTAAEKTTGANGTVEFTDLLVGKYRITETKAPEGYELAKNSIDVEVTKANRNLEVKATDRLKLILPETGGEGIIIFIISGIILMSLVLILKNVKIIENKKIE